MLSVTMIELPEQIAEALIAQALGLEVKEEPLNTEPWFALYEYVNSGPEGRGYPLCRAHSKEAAKDP